MRALIAFAVLVSIAAPASASETITYAYDARGRLVQVMHAGTVNNGVCSRYSYDKADNRANLTVATGGAPTPSFSINSAAATEGSPIVFTVTKCGTASGTLTVNYATASGTATSGTDFTSTSGTLSFLAGDALKTISVPTIDDANVESAEAFTATLSNASAGSTIAAATGTGIINDNDGAPTCSGVSFTISSNAAVTEGTNSVFTITKTGSTANSCSVNYATANGTATAGSDYTAASGNLTFTSGQTSQTVSVTTTDDAAVESAETFTMSLSAPTGGSAVGTPGSATATINDNDGNNPPTPVNDTGSQQKCSTQVYTVTTNDTDPDGDYPLTVTAVSGVGFSVYSSTQVQFTSTQSTGAKVGTYTVRDSRNATATATLTVTVSGGVCQ